VCLGPAGAGNVVGCHRVWGGEGRGAVVDLIMNDNVEVLLGVVLGNVLVRELLGGHFAGVVVGVVVVFRNGRYLFFWTICPVSYAHAENIVFPGALSSNRAGHVPEVRRLWHDEC
jgi:hypothetical protein